MDTMIEILRKIRAFFVLRMKDKNTYLSKRSLKPISYKYGYDRGKPIDRFYIEQFLEENSQFVKGRCLEVVDNAYTRKYGGNKVTKSDVLDIFPTRKANIHDDLRRLKTLEDNTYDCFILTQTIHLIDEYENALKESWRILKPGGTLLVTLPTISPGWDIKVNLWRVTEKGAKYIFAKIFNKENVFVKSYGNVESSQAYWVGLAQSDISSTDIARNDNIFPLIVAVRAVKKIKKL